jgi:hypothetical protein
MRDGAAWEFLCRPAASPRVVQRERIMGNEQEMLVGRFRALQAQGLEDVKFLLRNADEATTEQVCRDVNDMMAAYDRGESVSLDFKDSKRK